MIHQSAEVFGDVADAYERGRPDYPPGVIETIVEAFEVTPHSTVVDLAAGTGKFTRLLLATGAHVIAVEPVEGMRARLHAELPHVEATAGTAESMPLPDAAVDVVTAAQAFHWFRAEDALREIHRVLRPGGGLALIWNERDPDQAIQRGIDALVADRPAGIPTHRGGKWREAWDGTTLFSPLQQRRFTHEHWVDVEGLVDRVLSVSFVASLPETERAEVAERARRLAPSGEERFPLRYLTTVYWCWSLPMA